MEINEVVILVGGRGLRLDPLTRLYPKPLLMVNGKPFLEILIDSLKDRFNKFILCSWYKAEMFTDFISYYNAKDPYLIIINSSEQVKSGTAGALKNAEKFITNDYFFVMNGDTLFDTESLDYIFMQSNPTYMINEVINEAQVPTGVRILNKTVLDLIPYSYFSLEDDLCKICSKKQILVNDSFIDIGTLKSYENCNMLEWRSQKPDPNKLYQYL